MINDFQIKALNKIFPNVEIFFGDFDLIEMKYKNCQMLIGTIYDDLEELKAETIREMSLIDENPKRWSEIYPIR